MFSFLEKIEDPKRPYLGPNYWILNATGFILPKNIFAKIVYILIHEIGTLFVISQYMDLYVIRSDLNQVLTNLRVSMLSVVCVVKANSFLFWQTTWTQILDYVTEADRFERDNQNIDTEKIVEKYTKYSRRVTYFYMVLVLTTVLTTTTAPLVRYKSSANFREGYWNGTEMFPHIYSSWMPFDKNYFPGCWLTVLWHILISVYGGSVMASYDTCIVGIMVFFGGKLELLRERCRQMLGNGDGIEDREATNIVRQLHGIHVQLVKHSRLFNSVLSPVTFLYVCVCALMICCSAYQLTSSTNATQKLLMAEYLIFGIAQLFVYCWHSNDVFIKYENVTLGPYESEWWSASLHQKKLVLLLSGQLRVKNIFTAGPFVDLRLPTFITILKGAYSYYTLLRE